MTTAGVLPDEVARAYLLERFDDFLALEQGNAERTREAYSRDVARLAAELGQVVRQAGVAETRVE